MLREMGEFLDRYTGEHALLLVTEDLHWADRATIHLIDYFARRRSRCSVMWVASFRLTEVVASDQPLNTLRRELHLHGLCEELVLDSFSQADVAAYLAVRAPSMAHDDSFVRTLHERTEGVPLFVSSVTNEVSMRAEGGDISAAALLASSPLPAGLFAIIDHYLAKLSDERRQLLSAAAVCGLQFSIDTLARVLGRDTLWVADACDQLLREQVWLVTSGEVDPGLSPETLYAFRHALFRQALYDRLAPSARANLHQKVGLALEGQRDAATTVAAAELAMHFDRGRAPLAALRYYSEAAAAALHVSPSECMSLTERALGLADRTPPSVERSTHEIALATLRGAAAFHLLGAGDEARRAYLRGLSLLDEVPKHPMRALLLHGFGFLLNLRAEYAEALGVAARAEALASDSEDPFLVAFSVRNPRSGAHAPGPAAGCLRVARASAPGSGSHERRGPGKVHWFHCRPAGRGTGNTQPSAHASRSSCGSARAPATGVCPCTPHLPTDGIACHDVVRRALHHQARRSCTCRRIGRRDADARRRVRVGAGQIRVSLFPGLVRRPPGKTTRSVSADTQLRTNRTPRSA